MKELSIEEKAKRYDEAIERIKFWVKGDHPECFTEAQKAAEFIFPELKESKDEVVRKAILELVKQSSHILNPMNQKSMIAWLEKQGDHANFYDSIKIGDKVTRNKDGVLVNLSQLKRVAKPADKVEPKFHEGEWITNGDYTWKIVEVKPLDYTLQSQDGNIVDDTISHVDEQFHPYTIQDAKDGDVLAVEPIEGYSLPFIAIYKEVGLDFFNSYCFIGFDGNFYKGDVEHSIKNIHPATKEQRDALMKAMTDAGYEWYAEKKELKKIEQKPDTDFSDLRTWKYIVDAVCTEKEGIGQYLDSPFTEEVAKKLQKRFGNIEHEWSALDERNLQEVIDEIEADKNRAPGYDIATYDRLLSWLKSLKPQPRQEWSEEDEKLINSVIELIDNGALDRDEKDFFIEKLKSLRPQLQWRPSDEQMNALEAVLTVSPQSPAITSALIELYEQFKKLREE